MSPKRKEELKTLLFKEALLPALDNVVKVDRSDGVKLCLPTAAG